MLGVGRRVGASSPTPELVAPARSMEFHDIHESISCVQGFSWEEVETLWGSASVAELREVDVERKGQGWREFAHPYTGGACNIHGMP